jgi:hypothetical protein
VLLTYWWSGHEPGDVVEVDDPTARELLGVLAQPHSAEEEQQPAEDGDPTPEPPR